MHIHVQTTKNKAFSTTIPITQTCHCRPRYPGLPSNRIARYTLGVHPCRPSTIPIPPVPLAVSLNWLPLVSLVSLPGCSPDAPTHPPEPSSTPHTPAPTLRFATTPATCRRTSTRSAFLLSGMLHRPAGLKKAPSIKANLPPGHRSTVHKGSSVFHEQLRL